MEIRYLKLENTRDNQEKLAIFLHEKSRDFAEPLESRVNVNEYSKKLLQNGYVFAAMCENELKGIIGGYANDVENRQAYESILVTDRSIRGSGAAEKLFQAQKNYCKEHSMERIYFTTNRRNGAAIRFYEKQSVSIDEDVCNEKVIAYLLPL